MTCAGLVEHAAWTKADAYLDQPLKNMPWYRQLLLDVFFVLSMVAGGLAVLAVLVIQCCCKHIPRRAKLV